MDLHYSLGGGGLSIHLMTGTAIEVLLLVSIAVVIACLVDDYDITRQCYATRRRCEKGGTPRTCRQLHFCRCPGTGVFFEKPPHGAYPLDRRNEPISTALIPAVERAQFDGIRMLVVDGSVLAGILPVSESAPIVVAKVAHIEQTALGRVQPAQRPIPTAGTLIGRAGHVDVPTRVLPVLWDALYELPQCWQFGHVKDIALQFHPVPARRWIMVITENSSPSATHCASPSGHLSRYALKRRCAWSSRSIHSTALRDCDTVSHCTPLIEWPICFRALAGLEPARVPLGLDSQAVSSSTIRSVSSSVAPLRVIAVTVGVLI